MALGTVDFPADDQPRKHHAVAGQCRCGVSELEPRQLAGVGDIDPSRRPLPVPREHLPFGHSVAESCREELFRGEDPV
jgi:hypothetical protein